MLSNKLVLGSVQFGINYGISNQLGKTSEEEVLAILKYCNEIGLNTIDTASAYGNAEQVLGRNDLSDFQVISKFISEDLSGLKLEFDSTLKKLKVNNLYGYLAHRPKQVIDNNEQWDFLLKKKEENKIQKIGFSFNTIEEIDEIINHKFDFDIIQIPFNLLDHRFKKNAIELKAKGVEIHTRSTFLQGLFFMDVDKLSFKFEEVKDFIHKLQLTYKKDLPKALLNYVLNQEFIDKVVIGVNNKDQLIENISECKFNINIPRYNVENQEILIPSLW